MRLGWHVGLGPFYLAGTILRIGGPHRRRRTVYHGTLPGWTCPHNHTRPDTAETCRDKEARRRGNHSVSA